ncbi:MAG TPA: anthranilate phosphoribosyltransferase, partial [Geobacteraceae bacterium]|nr:anthranilate phosphoribosyltransferase [Geobacteraceae bacterium]
TNPAGAECQVMGVYREDMVEILAHVLHKLGCRRGFVVHGMDGMDEVTLTSATSVAEVTPEGVKVRLFSPEELGMDFCSMDELRGGDAVANAEIVRKVLAGEQGARRDIVLLNAAFALLAAGRVATLPEGVAMAADAIDSGRALVQLEKLVNMTNE